MLRYSSSCFGEQVLAQTDRCYRTWTIPTVNPDANDNEQAFSLGYRVSGQRTARDMISERPNNTWLAPSSKYCLLGALHTAKQGTATPLGHSTSQCPKYGNRRLIHRAVGNSHDYGVYVF